MNKFNYFLIVLIFILSFTKGALQLLGIPETILQLSIELLIFLLFFNSLLFIIKHRKLKGPGLPVNFFLFAIILISFFLTNVSTLQLILFLRKLGIYYLFFYALFNIDLSSIYKEKLIKLIIILFLIQILAAFMKLILLGGTLEKIVGTMSVSEGSLATIMPLMAISYLIVNYLEFRKIKYIFLILLFTAIGLISNKMGILFYIILLYVFLSVVHSKSKYFLPNTALLKKLFTGALFLIMLSVSYISLNPRANPEHKVGGSIDIEYLEKWITKYQTLDLETGVEGDGRFDAPFVAFNRLHYGGILNILFGFGPGEIVRSSFTPYANPLLEKYNIGYGGNLGMVWILMQIGIIGLLMISVFHFSLFLRIKKLYSSSSMKNNCKVYLLTSLGLVIVFFLDLFTYSSVMQYGTGVVLVYYFVMYYTLTRCSSNTDDIPST